MPSGPKLEHFKANHLNQTIKLNTEHEEIIATHPNLLKGSIRKRVLLYLAINQRNTNTISSIAKGIRTTNGRVSQVIVDLVSEGTVRSLHDNSHQSAFILDTLAD